MEPPAPPSAPPRPQLPTTPPARVADEPQMSGLAVAGFVMALVPFCMISLIGLILSAVAWAQIGKRPRELKGKGLAVAGVIIGTGWIVIGVIGVIAAIAIPSFIGFQAGARQIEARENLRRIHAAELAYREEHPRFAADFAELGLSLSDNEHYTFYLGDSVVPTTAGMRFELPADVVSFTERDSFMAVAVGNIDSDVILDVWAIGEDGWLDHVVDDTMEDGDDWLDDIDDDAFD